MVAPAKWCCMRLHFEYLYVLSHGVTIMNDTPNSSPSPRAEMAIGGVKFNIFCLKQLLKYVFVSLLYFQSVDINLLELASFLKSLHLLHLSLMPLCSLAKCIAMHKMQLRAGAIRALLYGFASVRAIIHSRKLVDYLPVQTHKPYNNFLFILFVSLHTFPALVYIMELVME